VTFPRLLNEEAAGACRFTVVMAFSDPGVGAWTIQVADGAATVGEGAPDHPDLVMTQTAETFEKTIRRLHNPVQALWSGTISVNSLSGLATFSKLFLAR
jgi:hypothetical protein